MRAPAIVALLLLLATPAYTFAANGNDDANREVDARNAAVPPATTPDDADADTDTGDREDEECNTDDSTAREHGARDADRHWPDAVAAEQQQLAALPPPADNRALRRLADRLGGERISNADDYTPAWSWDWRWSKKKVDAPKLKLAWLDELRRWLRQVSEWLGVAGHVLLWLLLLTLLLLLWKYRTQFIARWPHARDDARIVAGIDITPLLEPDALPDDVVAGAEHLWRAGHPREALSLLYRAALYRLGQRLDFAIPESGTEQECLVLVARHADTPTTGAFRALVNGWVRLAWQHQSPNDVAPLVDAYRRAASGADAARHPGHASPARGRPGAAAR